jgi:signal transduction histidine kinase
MAMLLIVGALAVRRLTRPLQRLAAEMSTFELQGGAAPAVRNRWDGRDEVEALGRSFQAMARRIAEQHEMQQKQSTAHREVIANVAHDLRTPLTALHGHLEALRAGFQDSGNTVRHLDTAIAQSDKMRRLIQQLFELATLQSMDQPVQGERFRFDEVVADAVQKFEVLAGPRRVALAGAAPGAVEVEGDLHLIERALTNLIDNAVRHTRRQPGARAPECDEPKSQMIEDRGQDCERAGASPRSRSAGGTRHCDAAPAAWVDSGSPSHSASRRCTADDCRRCLRTRAEPGCGSPFRGGPWPSKRR